MSGAFASQSFSGAFDIAAGGGGWVGDDVRSWREEVQARHDKLMLEQDLKRYGDSLRSVEKKIDRENVRIANAEKAAPSRSKQRTVDGILANIWKLEQERDAIQHKVVQINSQLDGVNLLLAAAGALKQFETSRAKLEADAEDETDIELLLLQ